MDIQPKQEPGPGTHGLRACNGYRYEFHIAQGTSLADKLVYRIEFTNPPVPAKAPGPTDAVRGGNEILWQLTGGTETMTVTRPHRNASIVVGTTRPVIPNSHSPP